MKNFTKKDQQTPQPNRQHSCVSCVVHDIPISFNINYIYSRTLSWCKWRIHSDYRKCQTTYHMLAPHNVPCNL